MDHKLSERLCKMYTELLEEVSNSQMNERNAEIGKNAISAILKLKTLEEMEKFVNGGSYRGRSYDHGGSYEGSYDGSYEGGSYDRYGDEDGRSYRRGRGMDGRYVSRSGNDMREKLHRLLQEADGREREIIMEMMEKM